jgi:hypothetical protein
MKEKSGVLWKGAALPQHPALLFIELKDKTLLQLFDRQRIAAIHPNRLPANHGRGWRTQEPHHLRHFLGLNQPARRDHFDEFVQNVFLPAHGCKMV